MLFFALFEKDSWMFQNDKKLPSKTSIFYWKTPYFQSFVQFETYVIAEQILYNREYYLLKRYTIFA